MNESWIPVGTIGTTPVLVNPKSSQYRVGASQPSANLLTHFIQGLNGGPLVVTNAAALAEHFIAKSLPTHFKWQEKITIPDDKVMSIFLKECENRLNAVKKKSPHNHERTKCDTLKHDVKKFCAK